MKGSYTVFIQNNKLRYEFTINRNITIIRGDSSTGKTTILNLIIGFMHPSKGRILIDGIAMNTLNLKSYRTHIAVVPQNSILFTIFNPL